MESSLLMENEDSKRTRSNVLLHVLNAILFSLLGYSWAAGNKNNQFEQMRLDMTEIKLTINSMQTDVTTIKSDNRLRTYQVEEIGKTVDDIQKRLK